MVENTDIEGSVPFLLRSDICLGNQMILRKLRQTGFRLSLETMLMDWYAPLFIAMISLLRSIEANLGVPLYEVF